MPRFRLGPGRHRDHAYYTAGYDKAIGTGLLAVGAYSLLVGDRQHRCFLHQGFNDGRKRRRRRYPEVRGAPGAGVIVAAPPQSANLWYELAAQDSAGKLVPWDARQPGLGRFFLLGNNAGDDSAGFQLSGPGGPVAWEAAHDYPGQNSIQAVGTPVWVGARYLDGSLHIFTAAELASLFGPGWATTVTGSTYNTAGSSPASIGA